MSDPSVRLRNAVIDGNFFIVSRLLKRFPDLVDNINPDNGWSNLHYSAYHDRYQISELILRMISERRQIIPSSPSSSSLKSSSSLLYTPSVSYTQITSEDEIKLTFDKDTVIHAACLNNAFNTLQLLLNYFNVCIDQRGSHGYTPSHLCCIHNFPKCLQVLLENGAYPNIQDDDGNTPLHLSLQYALVECCEYLVAYRADDSILNNDGWKPMDLVYSYEMQQKYNSL
ncbi:hypothetical protein CANARDRAFT_189303, partial [[Candida] arabinofermentans NRRL YB-2248]